MYKKSENNENEVLVSINDKNTAFTSYCNLKVSYKSDDYMFCMCNCDLQGCEGQYHQFTITDEVITYFCEDANILTVEDYKDSITTPGQPSENDIMITTLADTTINLLVKQNDIETRLTTLEGGGA